MQRLGVAGTAVPVVFPDLGRRHQGARDAACARLRGAAGRGRRVGDGAISRDAGFLFAARAIVSSGAMACRRRPTPPHATPNDMTTDNAPIFSYPLVPLHSPRINYKSIAYRFNTEWPLCFLNRGQSNKVELRNAPLNGVRLVFAGRRKSRRVGGLSEPLCGERRHFGAFRPSNWRRRRRRPVSRPFILRFRQIYA